MSKEPLKPLSPFLVSLPYFLVMGLTVPDSPVGHIPCFGPNRSAGGIRPY